MNVFRDFEDVSTALGCLPGEHHRDISADIKPAQQQAKNVMHAHTPQ